MFLPIRLKTIAIFFGHEWNTLHLLGVRSVIYHNYLFEEDGIKTSVLLIHVWPPRLTHLKRNTWKQHRMSLVQAETRIEPPRYKRIVLFIFGSTWFQELHDEFLTKFSSFPLWTVAPLQTCDGYMLGIFFKSWRTKIGRCLEIQREIHSPILWCM